MDSRPEQTQCFETWEDFDKAVKKVALWRINQNEKEGGGYCPELLFRGQANSGWELETTLERFSKSKEYLVDAYYEKVFKASQDILEFSKQAQKWKLPTPHMQSELLKKSFLVPHFHQYLVQKDYQIAAYFAFLRHHGFPSPLLDWTSSLDVAVYFAFKDYLNPAPCVSIYIYHQTTGVLSHHGGSAIIRIGSHIKGPSRHRKQKSEYTLCVEQKSQETYYRSHEDGFRNRQPGQHYKFKYNIRSTEREKILKLLDSKKINAITLFGASIDSRMTTTAIRSLLLED